MIHFLSPGEPEFSLVAGRYPEVDPVLHRRRSGVPRQERADVQLQTTSSQALHGRQVNNLFILKNNKRQDNSSSFQKCDKCKRALLLCRFRDACGLQFILTSQMQDLMKSQKTVRDAVKSLEGPASKKVIDEATICHLRPNRLPLNK